MSYEVKFSGFGYVMTKHEWKEVYIGEISKDLTSKGFNKWFQRAVRDRDLVPVMGEGTSRHPYKEVTWLGVRIPLY